MQTTWARYCIICSFLVKIFSNIHTLGFHFKVYYFQQFVPCRIRSFFGACDNQKETLKETLIIKRFNTSVE